MRLGRLMIVALLAIACSRPPAGAPDASATPWGADAAPPDDAYAPGDEQVEKCILDHWVEAREVCRMGALLGQMRPRDMTEDECVYLSEYGSRADRRHRWSFRAEFEGFAKECRKRTTGPDASPASRQEEGSMNGREHPKQQPGTSPAKK